MSKKGFTLIELIVVIAIITVLVSIILFSITTYINKGKDNSIAGNLAILVPAGEKYYDGNGGFGYNSFCVSSVVCNSFSAIGTPANCPASTGCTASSCNQSDNCAPGTKTGTACCRDSPNQWIAYAYLTGSTTANPKIYCVDSRGVKKLITSILANSYQCP